MTVEHSAIANEYDLRRFVDAQQEVYDDAIRSIRARVLDPAWMAFVFPRFINCYHDSATSEFAIASLDEARAYLANPLLGGRLMGASLDALADAFPESPLNIDGLGRWFGETHFGLAAQVGFGAVEGFLFGTAITVAIRYANRLLRDIGAG